MVVGLFCSKMIEASKRGRESDWLEGGRGEGGQA